MPTSPQTPQKRNAWEEFDKLSKRVEALEKNQSGIEEPEAIGELADDYDIENF